MRTSRSLLLLIPVLAAAATVALPPSTGSHDLLADAQRPEGVLLRRDGDEHGHMHHGEVKTVLNETEIELYHQPTPPSYWSIDLEDKESGDKRYPGLMGLHALCMGLAFFGALPAGACPSYNSVYRGSPGIPQASHYAL